MNDITLCYGRNCGIRGHCRRFVTSPTDEFQWYFTDPPFLTDDNGNTICKEFWGEAQDIMRVLEGACSGK